MRTLRDLLTTRETWTSREATRRALARAAIEQQRETLGRVLAEGTEVDPLDALADVTELMTLLTGWRWQAVAAAREQGASWEHIVTATGTDPEAAEVGHTEAVERQARIRASLGRG